jgi:hypothetical protein
VNSGEPSATSRRQLMVRALVVGVCVAGVVMLLLWGVTGGTPLTKVAQNPRPAPLVIPPVMPGLQPGDIPQFRLEQGRRLMDAGDDRLACLVWKEGWAYAKAAHDNTFSTTLLLKALSNVCVKRAADGLERANTCEALVVLFDFAVEGDGYGPQIEAALAARHCPR